MFSKSILILVVDILSLAVAKDLQLVLDENFDTFNFDLWQHELTLAGGGNWEFQWYDNNRTNSYVEDGKLFINPSLTAEVIGEDALGSATLDIWGGSPTDQCTANFFFGCRREGKNASGGNIVNPVKSARLRTIPSFYFRYGKVEVRAKLPKGDWLWPAIWMLPRYNNYGIWPASGEIDIMESRGNAPGYAPGGRNQYGSTIHWGPDYTANGYPKTHQDHVHTKDLAEDFHNYGLIWNETYIGTYFDTEDQVILSVPINQTFWERGGWGNTRRNPWQRSKNRNTPFDTEFYILINIAVGGTNGYFPDGYGKPWNNNDTHAPNAFWDAHGEWYPTWTQPMIVDYVKVWSHKGIIAQ